MNRLPLPNTTQVPNLIFDDLLAELSGAEFKVVMYLIRRTYGFGKDADTVSLSQFCEGIRTRDGRQLDKGTGLARSSVGKALESLEERGLIVVERASEENGGAAVNLYRLHLPEGEIKPGGSTKIVPGVVRKSYQGSTKIVPGVVRKSYPQNQVNKTKVTKAAATRASEDENSPAETLTAAAAGDSKEDPKGSPAKPSSPSLPDGVKLIDAEAEALKKLPPQAGLRRFRAEHPDKWADVEKARKRQGVNSPDVIGWLKAQDILDELRDERERPAPPPRLSQPDVSKLYGSDPRFLEAQRKAAERQAALSGGVA